MVPGKQIAYRAPCVSGRIELHVTEAWVSFFYLGTPVAYRIRLADLCSHRLLRLVRVNPAAYVFGGGAAILGTVFISDLYRRQSFSFGACVIAFLALACVVLLLRYRTITWYYLRTVDVRNAPFLFPCPSHLANSCDDFIFDILTSISSVQHSESGTKRCNEVAESVARANQSTTATR